jgi:hypothetical protein
MAVIKEDKLNQDVLLKVFQESAHEAAADDDGDVYITDGLEVPCWVSYDSDLKVVKLFTYGVMKEGVNRESALEFVNELNWNIALPSFSLRGDVDNGFRMFAYYYIPTQYGINTLTLISITRRFASAFKYSIQQDKEDIFFN